MYIMLSKMHSRFASFLPLGPFMTFKAQALLNEVAVGHATPRRILHVQSLATHCPVLIAPLIMQDLFWDELLPVSWRSGQAEPVFTHPSVGRSPR